MKIKGKPAKLLSAVVAILILVVVFVHMTVYAQEEKQHDREVIIVMDCSKSMWDVDSQYFVFDFVKELVASLPMNCKIELVVYNNEIGANLPIGNGYTEIENTLDELQYRQYGNAGAGMEVVVTLFQSSYAEKRIILISDGEIMMDSKEKTEESVKTFNQAVIDAKNNDIVIDVLAIGGKIQGGDTIYSAAENMGGSLYEIVDEGV